MYIDIDIDKYYIYIYTERVSSSSLEVVDFRIIIRRNKKEKMLISHAYETKEFLHHGHFLLLSSQLTLPD